MVMVSYLAPYPFWLVLYPPIDAECGLLADFFSGLDDENNRSFLPRSNIADLMIRVFPEWTAKVRRKYHLASLVTRTILRGDIFHDD